MFNHLNITRLIVKRNVANESEYESEQLLECVINAQSIHTMNIPALSTKFNVIEHDPHIDALICG